MPILNLKPLIFPLLNLFGLQSQKPELRDIAIVLRQSTLMHSVIRTVQQPMLRSLHSIRKDELSYLWSKIREIPTADDLKTLEVPTHPIVTEIYEGKRKVNEELYDKLFKEATTLLDSEYSKYEKYEHFRGNSIQFSIHKLLCQQLKELARLDKDPRLQNPLFKQINKLAFDFNDLACITNAKIDNQSQSAPIQYLACALTGFLSDFSEYSESVEQYQDIMKKLKEINLLTLCAAQKLNTYIDTLENECTSNERHLLLHLLKRVNKITQELCVRLTSIFEEIITQP